MALQPRGSWHMPPGMKPPREPMFNLPTVVMVLAGIMIAIQAAQSFLLSYDQEEMLLLTFSFLPVRYGAASEVFSFPGGVLGDIWTFVTYAFLHGGWMHVILNSVWMMIFATVIVRRIGTRNFLIFFVITAAAGALVHLLIHFGSQSPLVGVSAVLSGAMAASARFAFSGGMMGFSGLQGGNRYPCLSLAQLRQNRQAMGFLIIWLVLNLVFGLFSFVGGGASIAWEAHLGGFIAGLLVFPYLDPYTRPPRKPKPPKKDPPKKRPDHLKVIK
ncbi:rhomboid family intramembrane serine protease [uncultured Cohaesibacter sp.]|uniref:rhomboid family intramembrane serine protease n=1 Tax=uncultured Cohaesibacter sp. TaxID=1002546 RepID=UPI0029C693FE|nr:rhomboid family intramembrane serine protease [uncultured Cohaesibacter sp.]